MPQFNRPETFLAATAASISHRSCIETVAPETYAASQGWRSNHVKPLRKKLTPSRSVKSSGPTKSTKHALCRRIYPDPSGVVSCRFMPSLKMTWVIGHLGISGPPLEKESDRSKRSKRHMVGIESAPVWLYTAHLDRLDRVPKLDLFDLIRWRFPTQPPSRNSCLKLLSKLILNRNLYTSPHRHPFKVEHAFTEERNKLRQLAFGKHRKAFRKAWSWLSPQSVLSSSMGCAACSFTSWRNDDWTKFPSPRQKINIHNVHNGYGDSNNMYCNNSVPTWFQYTSIQNNHDDNMAICYTYHMYV